MEIKSITHKVENIASVKSFLKANGIDAPEELLSELRSKGVPEGEETGESDGKASVSGEVGPVEKLFKDHAAKTKDADARIVFEGVAAIVGSMELAIRLLREFPFDSERSEVKEAAGLLAGVTTACESSDKTIKQIMSLLIVPVLNLRAKARKEEGKSGPDPFGDLFREIFSNKKS